MMKKSIDNLPAIIIREMSKDDLAFAAECTAAEGWVSENLATLEGFYLNDPKGCLFVEESGKPVGICIATCYGLSGFIGELIVRPEARGTGVGAALLNQAVQILQDRGVETVYLDGVLKAVQLYERNGFHKVCRSWRFSGNLPGKKGSRVRRMSVNDMDQVFALDTRSFGADRHFFLRRRFEIFPELSYVMENQGRVSGYLLGRGGKEWLTVGPWVVEEGIENPEELLNELALEAKGRSISIGILDTHQQACELVQASGFIARPDSPWRMALGKSVNLGTSRRCYAIGSAAKG
jgi:ribosomal protein S18 acetylase RimI-like enzyme